MNEMKFLNSGLEVVKEIAIQGKAKEKMPFFKLALLGILAGIFIACGASASSVAAHTAENVAVAKLLAGVVFPVGFMMVVLIGGELFTGKSLLIIGVLDKKHGAAIFIKMLVCTFVLNMVGSVFFAFLVFSSGQFNYSGGLLGAYTIKVALGKVNISFGTAFVSGILCNIFVCFAILAVGAAKDAIGKIFAAFIPIMAFVVSGYEHSVANMYYIPAGMMAATNEKFVAKAAEVYGITKEQLANLNISGFLINNEIPVTLGNIVGGAAIVGVMMYLIYKNDMNK